MDSGLRRNDGGSWPVDDPDFDASPQPAYNRVRPRGSVTVTLERKAAAFDPLNLIRLTPA